MSALVKLGSTEIAMREGWRSEDTSGDGITRMRVHFPNGYSASIVRGLGTYGSEEGLFEGAVMRGDDGIVYDTPITDDVVGWMTEAQAFEFMDKVAALPAPAAVAS